MLKLHRNTVHAFYFLIISTVNTACEFGYHRPFLGVVTGLWFYGTRDTCFAKIFCRIVIELYYCRTAINFSRETLAVLKQKFVECYVNRKIKLADRK